MFQAFGCDGMTAGADGVITEYDGCGVCGGDGSTCTVVEDVYSDSTAAGTLSVPLMRVKPPSSLRTAFGYILSLVRPYFSTAYCLTTITFISTIIVANVSLFEFA